MSHASGLVQFEDGTLRHFVYDGTNDFPCPKLWASSDSAWKHLHEENRHKKCTCGRPPEKVNVFTHYGRGFEWQTTACRYCRVIIDCSDPFELGVLHAAPDWIIRLRETPVAQKRERARLANAPVPEIENNPEPKNDVTQQWGVPRPATDQEKEDQKVFALWAADCAERALPYFERQYPKDDRPRKAIEAARTWAQGGLAMSKVREAAFAAWFATRDTTEPSAKAAAFAAGHAVAIGHTPLTRPLIPIIKPVASAIMDVKLPPLDPPPPRS